MACGRSERPYGARCRSRPRVSASTPSSIGGWLRPSTLTPDAVAAGPSRRMHGYAPVPLRYVVNEEALAFVFAPTGASNVVRLGSRHGGHQRQRPTSAGDGRRLE